MRAVVQRVKQAAVFIDGNEYSRIGNGLVVLLGIHRLDTEKDITWMVEKILNLRIFSDEHDKMNVSLLEQKGELLVVSQFTLYGDCRKGRRPGYSDAAPPASAAAFYDRFIEEASDRGVRTATGRFQASMEVSLVNDGPVTLIVESRQNSQY